MKISGNTILITGGTSGIGFELAKQLLLLGNTVIVTGRDPEKLTKAKKILPGLHGLASDVSKTSEIEALCGKVVADFPNLNVLINNAGIMREINLQAPGCALSELTLELDTNLKGPIQLTAALLSHLKTQPSAAIVNVSSGLAFVPLPISPIYCATKAALHSFSLSLRVQLKNTRVKVFELAPPATATELLAKSHPDDMKGVSIMQVDAMVRDAIRGFEKDQFEIRPGQANQLKLMSRVAPGFILRQLSRSVDRMLAL